MEPERPLTLGDWLDLQEQMRAAELLLEEMQIAPADLTTYWAMSAELLAMLQEINAHLERRREHGPDEEDEATFLDLRKRLRALLARTEDTGLPVESD